MIALSKTVSTAFEKQYRKIKAYVQGKVAREAYECMPYGVDSNPIRGMDAIYAATEVNGIPVIVGYLNKSQLAEVGDMRIFSTSDSGTAKFNIWLRSSGEVLVGDSDTPADYTDFLVKFNQLKSGFDTLRTELNTFITAYNAHTHAIAPYAVLPGPPIPTGPALPTGAPATATIDTSKADKIKTK